MSCCSGNKPFCGSSHLTLDFGGSLAQLTASTNRQDGGRHGKAPLSVWFA